MITKRGFAGLLVRLYFQQRSFILGGPFSSKMSNVQDGPGSGIWGADFLRHRAPSLPLPFLPIIPSGRSCNYEASGGLLMRIALTCLSAAGDVMLGDVGKSGGQDRMGV